MPEANDARVAVVVKCWPRLSETFIAQEMAGLEARGLKLVIYSLRLPTDPAIHPVHARVKAPIAYLPEYLKNDPMRVLRAWWKARKLPGYKVARARFLKDLVRDRTSNRIRRFGQGMVLAAEMPQSVQRLYAHFLHTPSSATRYAALTRGIPWSASAHAKDIWTSQEWELKAKLLDIDWLITCTRFALARLKQLVPDENRLRLVYHGLDLANLPTPPTAHTRRDGSDPNDPVIILSVGRRVAKKGYDDLLEALSRLPKDLHWRFEHIGAGVLGDTFEAMAQKLGIGDRCLWHGARPQAEVFAAYKRADIFVLASKTAADGDQEGMPNVLQEAGYQRMAIVSTRSAAIGEFVRDGDNGLMADPAAPDQLAAALEKAARDPDLRARFGDRANEIVRTRFSYEAGMDWIAGALGQPVNANLAPQIETPEVRAAE
ncbi:MAG: glycosyltransferase family 4 protein [Alphaproteobacteria bacterium]|nr:glycosyltransferase family 4 protein [Alphaproteobacteria bacterium]